MTLDQQRREWDHLARVDPFWAVLSHRCKRYGRWDEAEFLASAHGTVETVLATGELFGLPARHDEVLDFGCGLGRLAPHLACRFGQYVGADISSEMTNRAGAMHRALPNCRFVAETEPSLQQFGRDRFDLVVSLFVLQHIDDTGLITAYLEALVRVIKPGGLLVIQLPAAVPAAARVSHRAQRSAYRVLRAAGLAEGTTYRRFRLSPMTMTAMRESDVVASLRTAGADVVTVERGRIGRRTTDRIYFAMKLDASPSDVGGVGSRATDSP